MLKVQSKRLGNTVILCLQGRIVIGELTSLHNLVECLTDVRTVILDFAQVTIIDAAGLGLLLNLREQAQSKGIALKLMNASERVRQVLEITQLNSVFHITSAAKTLVHSRGQPAAAGGKDGKAREDLFIPWNRINTFC